MKKLLAFLMSMMLFAVLAGQAVKPQRRNSLISQQAALPVLIIRSAALLLIF